MNKKYFIVVVFSCLLNCSFAQNVGIGTNTPLAKLDISSNNSGILIPRLTTIAKNAIPNPPKGLLVYDSTAKQFYYHDGTGWQNILPSSANLWQQSGAAGNEIKNTNAGGFWSAAATGLNDNTNNTTNPPTAPISGAGTRLMWIPSRSAFRAGTDEGNNWDAAKIGLFSFATGKGTTASGNISTAIGGQTTASGGASTAIGYQSIASGGGSTAIGVNTLASGEYSTALGYLTTASEFYSTAMGFSTTASGSTSTTLGFKTIASGNSSTAMGKSTIASAEASTAMGSSSTATWFASTALGWATTASAEASIAMGFSTTASGATSTAMGWKTTASGITSTAIGNKTIASGNNSTAMGSYGSTNNHVGSFIIHDNINDDVDGITRNSLDNQMIMKFDGGFGFYSGGASAPSMGFEKTQGLSVYGSNVRVLSGVVTANGVTLTSDQRFKNTIVNINYGLNTIMKLRPVSYLWNADRLNNNNALKGTQLGFIAQEVEKVIPSAVLTDADSLQSKSIKYMEIIPVLTKAIQEQQAQIELLQKQNAMLVKRLEKLENK